MKTIKKIEDKIWDFIIKHKHIIFLIIITIISLLVRYYFLKFKSGDYKAFLKPWFNELKENGGLLALNRDIGNYNLPYLTIMAILTYIPITPLYTIKAVSILFDYILALGMVKLIYILLKNNKNKELIALITYGVVLMCPTVILNSACWGQADSIYTAFIIWSIISLCEEKYLKAFIFLGISFAFKLQFMFILPLYILLYISKRKFSILYFGIIPITDFVLCLPAIFFGKSVSSCWEIYFGQVNYYADKLAMNFPNIYSLLFNVGNRNYVFSPHEFISKIGIIITFFVCVIMAIIVIYKKIEFNKNDIILIGLWSVCITTFLLPGMHDRYLYVADILSILYCILNKDKFYIPIGIEVVSLYTYTRFLFENDQIPIQILSVLFFSLIILLTVHVYKRFFKEKDEMRFLNA